MTDPALDFSVEAMASTDGAPTAPLDPWLERRLYGFGASEIAPLLVALGRASDDEVRALPKYMREQAEHLFERKARQRKAHRAGRAASRGQQAELPCFDAWAASDDRVRRMFASVTHERGHVPRSWLPLVDRMCPSSTATPDGWGVDLFGDDVGIEVKTTRLPVPALPWYWRAQVQQQNAVCAYPWSAVVLGEGWAHEDEGARLPPRGIVVTRDDEWIERIREACRDGWERVEALKGAA